MKKWMMLLVSGWMVLGTGVAGTLSRSASQVSKQPEEKVRGGLNLAGIREKEDQDRILAGWDEGTVVEVALKNDSMRMINRVAKLDGLQDHSVQLVLEHQTEKPVPSPDTWNLYLLLPPEQREGFLPLMENLIPHRYKEQPVQAAMARKYVLGKGQQEISPDTETQDLVAILLAPEPTNMFQVRSIRKILKDHAVTLAKRKLREEGRTFVVQEDGENPLLARIRPVVDALNAPMATGLEAAFRDLGVDVPDQDRTELSAKVEEWREKMYLGELPQSGTVLGKLTVGLGVEGYNAFVDEYNHGKNHEAP